MNRSPFSRLLYITLGAVSLSGCVEDAFLATVDLTIEADATVAERASAGPVLLTLALASDDSGDRTMGAAGELTPETLLLCDTDELAWPVETTLHQNVSGSCDEVDPHVRIEALSVELDDDCSSDHMDIDPTTGTLLGVAIAPVFPDFEGCARYSDDVTVALQSVD